MNSCPMFQREHTWMTSISFLTRVTELLRVWRPRSWFHVRRYWQRWLWGNESKPIWFIGCCTVCAVCKRVAWYRCLQHSHKDCNHIVCCSAARPAQLSDLSSNCRLSNIMSNPTEEKYRTIHITNQLIQRKLLSHNGARQFLLAVGFVEVSNRFALQR